MGQVRLLPCELKVRDKTGNEHQINRPHTEDLIGDVHVATLRVFGRRHDHGVAPGACTRSEQYIVVLARGETIYPQKRRRAG